MANIVKADDVIDYDELYARTSDQVSMKVLKVFLLKSILTIFVKVSMKVL